MIDLAKLVFCFPIILILIALWSLKTKWVIAYDKRWMGVDTTKENMPKGYWFMIITFLFLGFLLLIVLIDYFYFNE